MLEKRVIPSLLLKDGFLHKGKNFSNHRYVGDPINAVRLFNEKKVDELCIFDITKSIESKSPDINLLESIVSEAFMPISYGGGIASVDQADELFKIGIEKIFLNSSYFQDFDLINQLTDKFGVQSICLSIDYKKNIFRKRNVYTLSGQRNTKIDLYEVIESLKNINIGELLLTCIDAEGTKSKIDYEAAEYASSNLKCPVIYSGGVSSFKDIKELLQILTLSGVSVGNMFTFHGKLEGVLISYLNEEELKIIRNEI